MHPPQLNNWLCVCNILCVDLKLKTFKRKYGPKGVRTSTPSSIDKNVVYFIKSSHSRGRGVGVRKNNIVLYYRVKQNNMLHNSKPCVCGSLLHSRPNHRDCLLNSQYNDAHQ